MSRWWLLCVFACAGCASPVVGGECLGGLSVCDRECVNLDFDRHNCGACGVACEGAQMCIDGECLDDRDAAVPDAGDGGSDPDAGDGGGLDAGDGSTDDGGFVDGGGDGGGDGGTVSCDVGEILCEGTCVDPQTDSTNCGNCGNECASDELCSAGTCADVCDDPLELCDGVCVDRQVHADHCGACGVQCASGICEEGMCSAGSVGHLVVIGHDYAQSRSGMNWLAGNAVFLASGAPIRVLVYEGEATMQSIRGVDRAIDQVADSTGRSWMRTTATAELVPFDLAETDVFLVYSQHGATDAALHALGTEWKTALDSFVQRGGVIVLFDGGGAHEGTWQILDAAGLFGAMGRVDVTGDPLDVTAPGDAVVLNVPQVYRAERQSVRFETDEGGAVVEHADGPVVFHHVLSP